MQNESKPASPLFLSSLEPAPVLCSTWLLQCANPAPGLSYVNPLRAPTVCGSDFNLFYFFAIDKHRFQITDLRQIDQSGRGKYAESCGQRDIRRAAGCSRRSSKRCPCRGGRACG